MPLVPLFRSLDPSFVSHLPLSGVVLYCALCFLLFLDHLFPAAFHHFSRDIGSASFRLRFARIIGQSGCTGAVGRRLKVSQGVGGRFRGSVSILVPFPVTFCRCYTRSVRLCNFGNVVAYLIVCSLSFSVSVCTFCTLLHHSHRLIYVQTQSLPVSVQRLWHTATFQTNLLLTHPLPGVPFFL